MKKILFVLFIFCCSQMSAQIEFIYDSNKEPLLIYNSSDFDYVIRHISSALRKEATRSKETEDEGYGTSVSDVAKWVEIETNGYKMEIVAKKTITNFSSSGDKSVDFSLSMNHIFAKQLYDNAKKTFDNLKKDIITEMGNPLNCDSSDNSHEICIWRTNKVNHFLQISLENGYWIINNIEHSNK